MEIKWPDLKYEREGGPSIATSLDLIQSTSERPAIDQLNFLRRVIFNFLIGNADAHGKNFSLLYKGNLPHLSPTYDVMSTAVYPNLSAKMAMKIGGKYDPEKVFLAHWHRLVPDTKTAQQTLDKQLLGFAQGAIDKSKSLTETFKSEGISSEILHKIQSVISYRSQQILSYFK